MLRFSLDCKSTLRALDVEMLEEADPAKGWHGVAAHQPAFDLSCHHPARWPCLGSPCQECDALLSQGPWASTPTASLSSPLQPLPCTAQSWIVSTMDTIFQLFIPQSHSPDVPWDSSTLCLSVHLFLCPIPSLSGFYFQHWICCFYGILNCALSSLPGRALKLQRSTCTVLVSMQVANGHRRWQPTATSWSWYILRKASVGYFTDAQISQNELT